MIYYDSEGYPRDDGSGLNDPYAATAMELMARKGLAADEFGVLHPAGALGAALNNRRA